MALIPYPEQNILPERTKRSLEEFYRDHGRPSLLTLMAAWYPPLQDALTAMRRFNQEGAFEPWFRELLFVAASEARGCFYCAGGHSRVLVHEFGFEKDAVTAMRSGEAVDALDDAQRVVVQFVRKAASDWNRVTSRDIDILKKHGWGPQEIVEAIAMTMKAAFTNTLTAVLRLEDDIEVRGYF